MTPTTKWLAVGAAALVGVILVAVAGSDRSGTTDDEPSQLSLPTSGEIGDMTCARLNAVLDRTGAELGLNSDGSVDTPQVIHEERVSAQPPN